MHETSNVFAPTFFSSCDAESEMPEISNLAVFDPKPQNEDFFPSLPTVMNGVKRSETRVLALLFPLALCAARVICRRWRCDINHLREINS